MSEDKEQLRKDMDDALKGGSGPAISRFALACIGGAIPFVGGVFGATAGAWSEAEQKRFNKIFASWLRLQEDEIKEIGVTLAEVMIRLDMNDPKVEERVQSPAYLSIIKKCFRDWSATESEEKRILIRNLLANTASCSLTSDDVIKLFIEWIDQYSEAHFKVVGCIYNKSGITRYQIWQKLHGETVREDSADADLFKVIIRDLSMGNIIRQHREVDHYGNFIKPPRESRGSSNSYKSAFDNEEQYELTGLGKQFVHYTMNEIVPRIQGEVDNKANESK
jgi:hypothetical protein